MTNLDNRPVVRETRTVDPVKRRKLLVVRLEVGGRMLRIKLKGERKWLTVPFEAIYRLGAKIRAQELAEERRARRQAKRLAAGGRSA